MCVFMAGVAKLTFILIYIIMYNHRLEYYILCKMLLMIIRVQKIHGWVKGFNNLQIIVVSKHFYYGMFLLSTSNPE